MFVRRRRAARIFCFQVDKNSLETRLLLNVLKQFNCGFPHSSYKAKLTGFWAFPTDNLFIFLSCGILLHFGFRYASLAPVSQRENPRKYLINKYLKQHFKYQKVFHRLWKTCGKPSSKKSEKKLKRVQLQHFPLLVSKECLSSLKAATALF